MTEQGGDPEGAGSVAGLRIAADIGGTFTDVACLVPGTGQLVTRKLPSTPDDYARAILDGLLAIADELGVQPSDVEEVLHASTIATNAILEGKGAVTALLTTAGLRDVLELRRIRVPRLYEPLYEKPAPLVPRRRRFEVTERMGATGEIIAPLDEAQVRVLARHLADRSVEAVAVCFLHAYGYPDHERRAVAILREELPGRFVCASHEVLPEIREYERTSTTVANAYIGPTVATYLRSLQARLRQHGIAGRLLMMQSSGGTLDVDKIIAKPAQVVESGPAAGVVGAARIGAACGYRDIITFDMGGTTAKASLIEDGQVVTSDDYEVGGGISLSSRLSKGGGYALKLPVIDVSEVGAGGGSIVWVDPAGGLKVGPRSAGASPGPACYGVGDEPTVTDANVVLGFLNPKSLAGGTLPIEAGRSERALERVVAEPLGLSLLDAAYGVHRLANATMMRAVKAVSTARGRDPRLFTLFAFGGNGGVHAAELARDLQIGRVVIPRGAGVFSALGLLVANVEVAHSRAFLRRLGPATAAELDGVVASLDRQVLDELGPAAGQASLRRRADLRYAGQAFELPVELGARPDLPGLREAFEREHERTYGHRLEAEVDCVTVRVTGIVEPRGAPRLGPLGPPGRPSSRRSVYFGPDFGSRLTPVIDRTDLTGEPRPGPLVVEEYEGTTVVPPDGGARLDPTGNIVIDFETAT